jgi:hypothetical protein
MREYIELGSTPYNEECVQIGDSNYRVNAIRECRHYIQAIRTYLGMEPDGAHLTYKAFPHDMGSYYEVILRYDPEDERAVEYAHKCEAKAPATWDDAGMQAPELIAPARRAR